MVLLDCVSVVVSFVFLIREANRDIARTPAMIISRIRPSAYESQKSIPRKAIRPSAHASQKRVICFIIVLGQARHNEKNSYGDKAFLLSFYYFLKERIKLKSPTT